MLRLLLGSVLAVRTLLATVSKRREAPFLVLRPAEQAVEAVEASLVEGQVVVLYLFHQDVLLDLAPGWSNSCLGADERQTSSCYVDLAPCGKGSGAGTG